MVISMKIYLGLTAVLLLAACDSTPVVLNTPAGEVTCQNYTDEVILWDRPTAYPKSMPKVEAYRLCREVGVDKLYNRERHLDK